VHLKKHSVTPRFLRTSSGFCQISMLVFFLLLLQCKPKKNTSWEDVAKEEKAFASIEISTLKTPHWIGEESRNPQKDCPIAKRPEDVIDQEGCWRIVGTTESKPAQAFALRYRWYRFPDAAKPVIVFLNGGPGGNLESYLDMPILEVLSEKYRILLYDQRGSGASSPLTERDASVKWERSNKDASPSRLSETLLVHHVADLEALRENIAKVARWVVFGHSFGAHLALAYATAFPEKVDRLIAANGSADSSGFVTQSTLRLQMFEEISSVTLGKVKWQELEKKGKEGKLLAPDGSPSSGLFADLHPLLYTYASQTEDLPKALKEYAHANERSSVGLSLTDFLPSLFIKPVAKTSPTLDSFFPAPQRMPKKHSELMLSETNNSLVLPPLNATANQWTVCSTLVTPASIAKVAPSFQEVPTARRATRCAAYPQVTATYDVTKSLSKISAPTLLTGGSHDPLVPYALQQRDFDLMKKAGAKVSLIIFPKSGHNPDEDAACFEKIVLQFVAGNLPSGKLNCEP
jgi:pimeloyl-ACP methyl ester carboxylesterase